MDVVSFPVPSCLQAFRPLKPKARRTQPPFFEIGKYWDGIPPSKKDLIGSHAGRNGVFDLVTRDVTGFSFYAAAFRKDPVDAKTIHTKLEQAMQTGLICRKTGFFSAGGFTADAADTGSILYTIDDLFDERLLKM